MTGGSIAPVDGKSRMGIKWILSKGVDIFPHAREGIARCRDTISQGKLTRQDMLLGVGLDHRLVMRECGLVERLIPGQRLSRRKRCPLRLKGR